MPSVANAYVQIIPSMEGASQAIPDAIMPGLTEKAEGEGAAAGASLTESLKGSAAKLGAAVAAVISVKEIGEKLLEVGMQFDEMVDTIVVGTGASGDALEALSDSAVNVATTVPTTFAEAGDVIQNINTRMGATGKDLEDISERVLAAGQLLGEAVNMDTLTGAFNAFGVSTEDAAAKMDYLFGVGQATGIGFNDLTGIIEKNAPAMQQLGFSFEETANMAGLLDKAGMDAGGTMGKMGKALLELAEPGQSASDAFNDVIEEMNGYIESGDEAAALDLASKLFGTKGAAQFVGALESGAFSLDEIRDSALGAGDGIMGTMEATMDWPEKWQLVKNQAMAAIEPLGSAVMDGLGAAVEFAGARLDEMMPVIEGVAGAIGNFSNVLAETGSPGEAMAQTVTAIGEAFGISQESIEPFAAAVKDFAERAQALFQQVVDFIVANMPMFQEIGSTIGEIAGIVGGILGAAIDLVMSALEVVVPIVTDLASAVLPAISGALDAVSGALTWVSEMFTGFYGVVEIAIGWLSQIYEVVAPYLQEAFAFLGDALTTVGEYFRTASEGARKDWQALQDWVSGLPGRIVNFFAGFAANIGQKFNSAKEKMKSAFQQAQDFIAKIPAKITGFFSGLAGDIGAKFEAVKTAITTPIETAKDAIGTAIDGIKGFFASLGNVSISMPHVPLPHFSISPSGWKIADLLKGSIPSLSVSWYAKGGIVDGATLIGAGEAGREAIVPLERRDAMAPFADAVADRLSEYGSTADVIRWLDRNLGPTINAYTPTMGKRELRRQVGYV